MLDKTNIFEIPEELKQKWYTRYWRYCRKNQNYGEIQSIYFRDPDQNLIKMELYADSDFK